MDNPIILQSSDEAATRRAIPEGWVSRHGRYYGDDEKLARWDGSTHNVCACGNVVEKMYTACAECRAILQKERYDNRQEKEWNGTDVLYSDAFDFYLYPEEEDLYEHCEEHDCAPEDLQLLICDKVFPRKLEEEYFYDDLPEEGDMPAELLDAISEFNERVSKMPPMCWQPSKYKPIIPPKEES